MSGFPVVIVSSGGIPVTEAANGTPYSIANNGFGTPVTFVDSGGLPLKSVLPSFERVVFVGASIMFACFGRSLTDETINGAYEFRRLGLDVEVYGNCEVGAPIGRVSELLEEAMTAFPSDTLFFVHAGGNNVSNNKPYPGGETSITNALNGLIDIASARPGTVLVSDITFRDYDDLTEADESLGSKPYNDNIFKPIFQTRKSDLVSNAYYTDGTPVSCLYELTYYNRAEYLSADNIHPTGEGVSLLRWWLAQRLAPVVRGEGVAAQVDRTTLTAPDVAGDLDAWVEYGAVNLDGATRFYPVFDNDTSVGPLDIDNFNGTASNVTLTVNFNINMDGSQLNSVGRSDGQAAPLFDATTLFNNAFTRDSMFVDAGTIVEHVIEGLEPNASYDVSIVASRAASGPRESQYAFSNGESVTIDATANPTTHEPDTTVSTMSDGSGAITITQTIVSSSYGYISGLHIKKGE